MRGFRFHLGIGLMASGMLTFHSTAQEQLTEKALPVAEKKAENPAAAIPEQVNPLQEVAPQRRISEPVLPLPVNLQPYQPMVDSNGDTLAMPTGDELYCPAGCRWAEADLLLWWMKGANTPPLLSSSPAGTPISQAGVLGTPGARTLFGGETYNQGMMVGGRFTLGRWLNDERTVGAEIYGLILPGGEGTTYSAGTPGIVSRPYVDATTNKNAAELVSYPGTLNGNSTASVSTGGLFGAGALGIYNVAGNEVYRLDAVGGFRYLTISDDVNVTENLTTLVSNPGSVPTGTNFNIQDKFQTGSQFYGADLGLRGERRMGRWFVDGTGRIALGSTCQTATISGNTIITVPGQAPVTNTGGLLALSSNIGSYSRNVVTIVPEAGCNVGYFLTENIRLKAGYTFLYWSSVARAGNIIDPTVNPNLLPPATPGAQPARPAFDWNGTGLWAQGINLGLEWRF